MRLHAIVDDLGVARDALVGGATVLQLRVKGLSTEELVARGEPFALLAAETEAIFVVNDDVEAALRLRADGVHLGRDDGGMERARDEGLLVGLSAASVGEAVVAASREADYIGAGPVWATPSKPDADPPIGLDGLRAICDAVAPPVIAIGGVDTANAADCIAAGAAGVAVIRGAGDARALRAAIDEALAAR